MRNHYSQLGLRCLPAPNRYRKMLAASLSNDPAPSLSRYATVKDAIVERMMVEFPEVPERLGLDIDPRSGDTILIWAA